MRAYLAAKRALKWIWVVVWTAGPGAVCRMLRRRAGPEVRILCYHRVSDIPCRADSELEVSPKVFDNQLRFLVGAGYRVIPLTEVSGVIGGARPGPTDRNEPPQRYIVITFDDGYRDNVTEALPILERWGLRAAFFLTTGFSDSGEPFPWVKTSAVDPDSLPLTWDGARVLLERGHEIHSHGVTHPNLARCGGAEIRREMADSGAVIRQRLGVEPTAFCYPFGLVSKVAQAIAAGTGYTMSCTLVPGVNRIGTHLHLLRRIPIQTTDSLAVFKAKLDGAFDWSLPQPLISLLRSIKNLLDKSAGAEERRAGKRKARDRKTGGRKEENHE